MLDLSASKYEISLHKYVAKKVSLNNIACVWCCTCGMQVQIWPASHKPIPVLFSTILYIRDKKNPIKIKKSDKHTSATKTQ